MSEQLDTHQQITEIKQYLNTYEGIKRPFLLADVVYKPDVIELFNDLLLNPKDAIDCTFVIKDKVARLYNRYTKYRHYLDWLCEFNQYIDQRESFFWIVIAYITRPDSATTSNAYGFLHQICFENTLDYTFFTPSFAQALVNLDRRIRSFEEFKDTLNAILDLRLNVDETIFENALSISRPFSDKSIADLKAVILAEHKDYFVLNNSKHKTLFLNGFIQRLDKLERLSDN